MAILGGSVLPPVQASIIDCHTLLGMPAVNLSFILPFICFVVIVVYVLQGEKKIVNHIFYLLLDNADKCHTSTTGMPHSERAEVWHLWS